MPLVLGENKFNEVKKVLKEYSKDYNQTQIANKVFLSRRTVNRINVAKDYKDYLQRFTKEEQNRKLNIQVNQNSTEDKVQVKVNKTSQNLLEKLKKIFSK